MIKPNLCGRLRGALLAVLWAAALLAASPARADSDYEKSTREATDQLIRASDLLITGHAEDARAVVRGMGQSFQALDSLAGRFREIANREHARCSQRIGELDVTTNQLLQQQIETSRRIAGLIAQLEGAATRTKLAEAEIARLSGLLDGTIKDLQNRQAKLEEMRKWWWVPFYGQYLAIRTLVDNDIGNYNAAVGALRDEQQRLASHANDRETARRLIGTLTGEKRDAEKLHGQLAGMRASAQTHLGELNATAVFLTDADVFWGLAQNLVQVDADSFVRKMKIVQDALARDVTSPSFKDPSAVLAQSLRQKLVEFAASVDRQSNFLLKDATEFCGGPPRDTTSATPVSQRCNIGQITAFYEIVDPKTCAFRYANPPGCPPAARQVSGSDEALAAGRGRGTWTRADGQNWIGRSSTSPCVTPGTIFYGKLDSPAACEASCMRDAQCSIWSFNTHNGFMPNSLHQCWGGAATLGANKTSWGGFTSGGIR